MIRKVEVLFRYLLYTSLVMICVFIIFGCSGNDDTGDVILDIDPVLLLPMDDEIRGWVSFGSYEVADDYDSLYKIVGNIAQVHVDNGFVSGVYQQYIDTMGKGTVTINIYNQGSEANASVIYGAVAKGLGTPWGAVGREARITTSLASYTIEFWQKNFFVQVTIDEQTDIALSIAKLFAMDISRNIG